jgi:GNAT superfamily N-acetyltransferase
VLLRQLALADIPEMLEVQREAYEPSLHEPASSFEEKLTLFPRGAIGAFEGGRLVAYAVTLAWRGSDVVPLSKAIGALPYEPDTIFIHDLASSPARRGKGIAKVLVERIFAIAAEMSITKFSLVAVQGAEPFWARFGFQPVEAFLYAPGVPATRMTLNRLLQ